MKRAIPIIVVLVTLVGGWFMYSRNTSDGAKKDMNQYRLGQVEKGKVRKTVSATGVLKPWTTVDLRSRAGGRVLRYAPDADKSKAQGKEVPIDEGTMLKKGQPIVYIDPSDTELTVDTVKADIDSNRARVDETKRTLTLQEEQTSISIANAKASLQAIRAGALATKARSESARKQAEVQKELSKANLDSAKGTLDAEVERLRQLRQATNLQQRQSVVSSLSQAQANLKNATLQLTRQRNLLEKGFIAASVVDQAEATYEVAKATYDAAKQRLDTIDPELDADVKAQIARVNQVRAQYSAAKANQADIILKEQAANASEADYQRSLADIEQGKVAVRQAEANRFNNQIRGSQILQAQAQGARSRASLVNAQIQLKETTVIAPSDGIFLKKYIDAGTLISSGISAFSSTGSNIISFGDTTRMYVDVQVDETDIANVELDQKVDIVFDAYATTTFEGKVIRIDPQMVIEQNVTTSHVRVEVDNSATTFQLLKPGMNATCEFIINQKEGVVSVPNEALKSDSDGSRYVEIASGGKPAPADKGEQPDPNLKVEIKLEKRKVEVELEGNDSTEIKSGIKEGETVILQVIEPTVASGGSPFGGGKGPGRK
ncbi:MAG: efflux RND transporter periplasmic adaptor subunit [Armatimonadetes bacterium]|nr:efflux RND transporter periplasmic adaptor subunit [Armatimonadota bacterium]